MPKQFSRFSQSRAFGCRLILPFLLILTLMLSLSLTSCSPATDHDADTLILHNINGYTLLDADPNGNTLQAANPNGNTPQDANATSYTLADGEAGLHRGLHRFEAIAIRDGRVLQTGPASELLDAHPGARRMDGGGRTLLPGLIDAHAHVMGLGDAKLTVNLMGIRSLDATLDEVARYGRQYADLTWIRGRGWNQVLWPENRFPTATELDEAVSGRPVWLTRVDGHAGWANTRAMQIAGITRNTRDPEGGAIIRDEEGEPTGVFIDRAMDLIRRHIPPLGVDEKRLALQMSLEEMRSMGLTGVHDAGVDVSTFLLMKEFADRGELTVRIYGMIGGTGEDFDRLSSGEAGLPAGPLKGYADDRLYLQSVKIYSDGALGSRGAALLEDYSDEPGNRGLLLYPEEELFGMVSKAVSHGYQVAAHAIGDSANRVMLDVFEEMYALADKGGGLSLSARDVRALRHRIEHAQVVHPDDIPRFRELDIIAAVQPVHATSDMNMAEDRIGRERMAGAYAWRTFLDEGVVLAAGSDFPVELSNPFHGLHAAVTRQDHAGRPEGGWYPQEKLTRTEALHAFSLGAAYAGHMEQITGSLEPGKWADFILIDQDYFKVPEPDIRNIRVLETWLAGKRVY